MKKPPSDEGGGKIEDFDGGREPQKVSFLCENSANLQLFSPSVAYGDSSLIRGSCFYAIKFLH